jgi:hypothetical protein
MFNLVKDDTSSLLWLRDAESCGTYRSVVNENLELIDMMFDFDQEIFSSKVYRMATRSNMMQALLDGQHEDEKPVTSFPSTVTSSNGLGEDGEDESDKQTIRERMVDTSRPSSRLKVSTAEESQNSETGGLTEVRQDLQPERVTHPNSPALLAASMSTRRENRESAKARKQIYRKQIPQLPRLPLPSPVISQQKTETQFVKVLILGTSESGKSTLFKSITAHQGLYTDDIRSKYRLTIFKNTLDNMQRVLEARQSSHPEDANFDLEAREFAAHCQEYYYNLTKWDMEGLSPEVASLIKTLWKEPSVRNVVEPPHQCYIADCAE